MRTKRPEWMLKSKCAHDPNIVKFMRETRIDPFYDLKGKEGRAFISAYCSNCPVKLICKSEGFTNHEKGTWGGITESQRRTQRQNLHKDFLRLQEQLRALLPGGAIPNA